MPRKNNYDELYGDYNGSAAVLTRKAEQKAEARHAQWRRQQDEADYAFCSAITLLTCCLA